MQSLRRESLRSFLISAAVLPLAGRTARAQTACGADPGPDVIIADIPSVANYAASGGFDALAIGHVYCNVGSTWLDFFASTNRHPVSGSALFRLREEDGATRFEQVGLSWLHHGFFALSSSFCCTCTPTDGTHLGVGCSDPSSAARCGAQTGLGPRWQVDAHAGDFPHPPASPPFSGSVARRLRVAVLDLAPTGGTGAARYFVEKLVLAPDDAASANQSNNASYREALTSFNGATGEWTFALTGSTQREKPAIQAWQDADPSVQITPVQVPNEGLLLLGSRATDLADGTWHYEYALYNMSSDLAARAFSVQLAPNVAISNLGFHDVDHHSGDGIGSVDQSASDWSVTIPAGALVQWSTDTFQQNPNANALRWGTLYNFRFDADAPPVAGPVTLDLFKSPASITPAAVVPGASASPGFVFCRGDGLDPLTPIACPCANFGAAQNGCANSANAGGARLLASGSTAPDTVVLTSSGELASALSIFLQGDAQIAPASFGDGVRCIGGNLKRLAVGQASGGMVSFPGPGDPSISAQSAALGDPLSPGSIRAYQTYYRDPDLAFCPSPPGNAWNVTNGLQVPW